FEANDDDALHGKRYDDAIANGSYRFDQHHQDKPGITFRYLDGTLHYSAGEGHPPKRGRWRPETKENPTFYQIPLRSIIPPKSDNVILAGRMFDAGLIAFSGMRVMVNMNQLGEAAGVASYLALNQNIPIQQVNPQKVRETLKKDGSIIF
ncbi:MAG: FAD-dependent oxidoreductase, partial [Planctomycetaceae bacterium]|nr:FAD-dependent oxidoreductase [Planctomycetaceae bacterium]